MGPALEWFMIFSSALGFFYGSFTIDIQQLQDGMIQAL
jgi:hypothetical protein